MSLLAEDFHPTTPFWTFATFLSAGSLLGSALAATLIIPSIGPGFYGGTAVFVFFVVILQVAALVAGIVVPMIVQLLLRRLKIPLLSAALLLLAVVGVLLEVAACATYRLPGLHETREAAAVVPVAGHAKGCVNLSPAGCR